MKGPDGRADGGASHRSLSRRHFLSLGGGALAGVVAGCTSATDVALDRPVATPAAGTPGTTATPLVPTAPTNTVAPIPVAAVAPERRVLVVVQLAGGNDALDTVVPVADGRYHDLRPTLALDDTAVVALPGEDDVALHPALAPLAPLYAARRLAVVQSLGMPGQSRSHFVALDSWWSATPGVPSRTGWLGRWLDATLDGGLDPDDGQNPLRAVAVGGGSPALAAEHSRSTVIATPELFGFGGTRRPLPDDVVAAFVHTGTPTGSDPALLAAARAAVGDTAEAVELLGDLLRPAGADGGGAREEQRGQGAAELLQTAAGIVELDVGTRIVLVSTGGFDTHAGERATHDALLGDLADGLAGFLERLETSGHADRVCVLTTSEFGRRAAENGSGGTDHGSAGTQFLIGAGVDGGRVLGDLDLVDLDDGDLRIELDTRSVYAAALDWLSGPGGPTDEVLGAGYDRYGLVRT